MFKVLCPTWREGPLTPFHKRRDWSCVLAEYFVQLHVYLMVELGIEARFCPPNSRLPFDYTEWRWREASFSVMCWKTTWPWNNYKPRGNIRGSSLNVNINNKKMNMFKYWHNCKNFGAGLGTRDPSTFNFI